MKKYLIPLAIISLLFFGFVSGYHDNVIPTVDNTYDLGSSTSEWKDIYIDGTAYVDTLELNGATATTFNKTVPLPLNTFFVGDNNDAVIAPLSTSTAPGLEEDNTIPAVVWADGETSLIQVTFRVPDDYVSGGAFRVVADESDSTTPNQIDFAVYNNSDGAAWDTDATDQTPVALTEGAGTAETVTLSPSTDFASLSAGDIITVQIWRDDTANGTGDLEIYYVEFYYN